MSKLTDAVLALAGACGRAAGMRDLGRGVRQGSGQPLPARVYIDKPDGVSIQDCEDFSRALDPILDEADPIPDSYIFEVSSAGAERQLKRPGDFARFLGAQVEVRLYQPVDGSKVHIGTLEQYDNGDVTVSDGKTRRVFQKSAIAQVRLHLTI